MDKMDNKTEVERFDKNPSQVTDVFWIYSRDSIFQNHTDQHDGKWMMIFKLGDLDARWNQACNLFRDGRLKGISSIKVSTAKPNPESIFKPGEGIIIFYCGPSEEKHNIMEYGRNILKYMWYPRSHFYFKSDNASLWSNLKYKHLYFIETGEHEMDLPNTNSTTSSKESAPNAAVGSVSKTQSTPLEFFYGVKVAGKTPNNPNSVNAEYKSTAIPGSITSIYDMNKLINQKNSQLTDAPSNLGKNSKSFYY